MGAARYLELGEEIKTNVAYRHDALQILNRVRRSGRMQVALNGEQIVDLKLDVSAVKDRPRAGYIGLQDHGLPCAFRNIQD